MDLSAIPPEVAKLKQFVLWRLEDRTNGNGDKKQTKVPYCAKTGGTASSTREATWSTLSDCQTALKAGGYTGIGIVFTKISGLMGVDLDHCIDDGRLDEFAQLVVDRFDSYTEVSPSGDGLHILCWGQLPGKGINRKEVEMYDSGRFFTLTGVVWKRQTTLNEGGDNIAWLYNQYQKEPAKPKKKADPAPPSEYSKVTSSQSLVDAFCEDDYCNALWNKRIAHKSQSEYDLAIASCAVQRSFSEDEIHLLVKAHRIEWHAQPEKADRKAYMDETITKAYSGAYAEEAEQNVQIDKSGEECKKKPYFIGANTLVSNPKKLRWVIKNYIPESSIIWLAGQWSTYKSFLALHMAYHVSLGFDWCGNKVTPGKVVFIASEGFGGFGKRIKALEQTYGHSVDSNLVFTPEPVCINKPKEERNIIFRAENLKGVSLIIVDTKSANMEGSDSDAATVNEYLAALRRIQNTLNVTIMVVDHVGHMEKARPRGASQQMGAADAVFMIERDEEEDAITVRTEKDPKDFSAPPPQRLEAKIVMLPDEWSDEDGEATTSLALISTTKAAPVASVSHIATLGKQSLTALKVLQAMHKEYKENLKGTDREPRIERKEWRNRCLSAGVKKQTFTTIPETLERRSIIRLEGDFVYYLQEKKA